MPMMVSDAVAVGARLSGTDVVQTGASNVNVAESVETSEETCRHVCRNMCIHMCVDVCVEHVHRHLQNGFHFWWNFSTWQS